MNEKVNLEGIMYEKDGSFKPLTSSHGNISSEIAYLRDTYMEAEKGYFEKLLSDDNIRKKFAELVDKTPDYLFNYAMEIQKKLENGELETDEEKRIMQHMSPEMREAYHLEKLESAEGMMCLLYAAIRDKVKIRELVLTPSHTRK